jgi:hypothetical protein
MKLPVLLDLTFFLAKKIASRKPPRQMMWLDAPSANSSRLPCPLNFREQVNFIPHAWKDRPPHLLHPQPGVQPAG